MMNTTFLFDGLRCRYDAAGRFVTLGNASFQLDAASSTLRAAIGRAAHPLLANTRIANKGCSYLGEMIAVCCAYLDDDMQVCAEHALDLLLDTEDAAEGEWSAVVGLITRESGLNW